jgi:DNA-binding transcriptional regulator YiaG
MNDKEIRAIRGAMDETDFALLMGVSPVTIWRWERKGCKPDGASIVLLELMRDHRRETMRLLWKRLKPKMKA